ncbi:DUF1002 domain-containing protein [Caldibacillus thermoamylovorans]|uniref:DUF1002 domain-containing protein n=1 Tax=Caldibacillus thermoamylovorans TaxID=35841 RepID=UPI001D08EC98|nr:DUF1002 domain-containing protein [Caldibacillus thermoamylovorans]MCB5936128.1 DUF1002 domain-containing protein [Bacillus sp. DFI.2.34]MCB7078708.1 DUF1002 domain-containing protein [Caldibacillus thermoamylovorans]
MFKKMLKVLSIFIIFFGLSVSQVVLASEGEKEKVIDEKNGPAIVVLGERLSEAQKEQTRKLLKVDEEAEVKEIIVTGADAAKYIKGDPNSNMYSSAKIKRLDKGEGIRVIQVTPENITEVTNDMYANALLTAGVEDAQIEVASPVKVTGHSALTGIFKAYEATGEKLDTDRLKVANEELDVATKLAEDAGVDQDKVSQLLTEIKQAIAEQNPATKEEVEQIVQEQLKNLNIELSPKYKQMLIDLFDKIRSLDINFDEVKSQLENLAGDIQKKLEDAGVDKGFLQSVADFIKQILQSIADFFKSLFS